MEAELPEPEILEQDGGILVTLFKNKYSVEQLKKMNLNERQIKAVLFLLENTSITNKEYQSLTKVSKPTATRDLQKLELINIIYNKGTKGSSSKYVLV